MKTRGSLLHSMKPTTCPYPQPDQSYPYPLSNFLEAHFNVILSSMPRTSELPLSLRFPHQNPICTSPLLPYVPCPAHCILFDLITQIIIGEDYRSLSSSLCRISVSTNQKHLSCHQCNDHFSITLNLPPAKFPVTFDLVSVVTLAL